jgi:ankyrin repeat protein
VVEALLQQGADMRLRNKMKETPLSIAEARKDEKIISILKEYEGKQGGLFGVF